MKIQDHLLVTDGDVPITFVEIPNFQANRKIREHEYLVMHYTAGQNAQGAINWFKDPNSLVSAHLIIARDGSVTQLVPFDTIAWHCGTSNWAGRNDLNNFSIGIEFDNFGWLNRINDQWIRGSVVYPEEEVLKATHKLEFSPRGWHIFTEEQIEIGQEITQLLFTEYNLLDVIGHDDISLTNKPDPGPAFSMERFREVVFPNRASDPIQYHPVREIPLRSGAGEHHPALISKRLEVDTIVSILEYLRGWSLVVVESENDLLEMQGWIPTRQLKRVMKVQ